MADGLAAEGAVAARAQSQRAMVIVGILLAAMAALGVVAMMML
jgi:hypothetical protein